jgi:hypothetical protein
MKSDSTHWYIRDFLTQLKDYDRGVSPYNPVFKYSDSSGIERTAAKVIQWLARFNEPLIEDADFGVLARTFARNWNTKVEESEALPDALAVALTEDDREAQFAATEAWILRTAQVLQEQYAMVRQVVPEGNEATDEQCAQLQAILSTPASFAALTVRTLQ